MEAKELLNHFKLDSPLSRINNTIGVYIDLTSTMVDKQLHNKKRICKN